MEQTVKIMRGAQGDLTPLPQWQLGYTTDTKRVYIGNGIGNVPLANSLSQVKGVARVTVDIVLDATHYAVFCEAAVEVNVYLPDAITNQGQMYIVKKVAGAKKVNIRPAGTDLIEGTALASLGKVGDSLTMMAELGNWWII